MSRVDALPKLMHEKEAEVENPKYANIVGWLLAVSMVYAAILVGGSIGQFINMPSILIVLGLSYFLGIAAYGWRDFNYSVKALLFVYRRKVPSTLGIRHVNIIRNMRWYIMSSGLLGFLVGLVQMLANLDDPAAIGPAAAVAMLTIFYSVVLILFICQPALSFLENHLQHSQTGGCNCAGSEGQP